MDKLKEELAEAMDLVNLFKSKEFQTRLLPKLLKDSQQVWLDPLKFPSEPEFQRAYNLAYAKAQVAIHLIDFLSKQEERVKQLQKMIDTPEKNYAL